MYIGANIIQIYNRQSQPFYYMMSNEKRKSGKKLNSILRQARKEYEFNTKQRTPEKLTNNLSVETFWEAENQLLQQVPSHVSNHSCIADIDIFRNIIKWKAPRVQGYTRELSSDEVKNVTERALNHDRANNILDTFTELKGVGPSVASAILMYVNPDRYTVMDPRATAALSNLGYWELPNEASTELYQTYCLRVQELSQKSTLNLRDVDRALFEISDTKYNI